MVTPELERAYARRGIALIGPDAGAEAFLAELAHGTDPQVVLMADAGTGTDADTRADADTGADVDATGREAHHG